MAEAISVVTVTHGRPALLARAMASIAVQDYIGGIEHVIVVDDDDETFRSLAGVTGHGQRRVVIEHVRRPAAERCEDAGPNTYPRLARLLNIGIRRATSPWIAFLDDDNEYEPEHLSSLHAFAEEGRRPAVHSARQMLWPDGEPYLEPRFPGPGPDNEQARIFALLCERGVCHPGTNIVRDRIDFGVTTFPNSTVIRDSDPVVLVDQNLWLIQRAVLLQTPVPEVFTPEELDENTCPDDKLLEALTRAEVPIASNGAPTVRYYLGGISNQCSRRDG